MHLAGISVCLAACLLYANLASELGRGQHSGEVDEEEPSWEQLEPVSGAAAAAAAVAFTGSS